MATLSHNPRSALLPSSTVQGGFFFKHSGRPSTQSKQFKTANTNRRTKEKGAALWQLDEKGPNLTGASNNRYNRLGTFKNVSICPSKANRSPEGHTSGPLKAGSPFASPKQKLSMGRPCDPKLKSMRRIHFLLPVLTNR
ncbi:hypothetical protein CRG98_034595 [Punica granatum]|uniref:Uncharacterized protein n=1 Tax=Punica granatum TaxID=22663 RepID=A0A2I0IMU6_PUNGR|nr:hypothetical protein CRG98_034595 [Punica granatum]